jgi:excisionase family DNA binding protein
MSAVEVLAVNVAEAARRLGVSPRTLATLIASKELPSRKIGRRRVIPVRSLEDFLRRDHATGSGRSGDSGQAKKVAK